MSVTVYALKNEQNKDFCFSGFLLVSVPGEYLLPVLRVLLLAARVQLLPARPGAPRLLPGTRLPFKY